MGCWCVLVSGVLQHESVITKKPHHHHTHTQAPTMGLRSHEYENTKHTPLALKTSSPHTPPLGIKKGGAHPFYKNTPHKHTRMRYTHHIHAPTPTHIKKGGLWSVETRCFN
ncbi:hypothetical protein BXA20_10670 [Corynebacterium diphtheriae]|nr:hypothetical protein BXA20_10670 [Corynebacterium diphtheriae]